MTNPLLRGDLLPPFDAITPAAIEPAIRELLASHRRVIAALEAQPQPTFENVVMPLEHTQHRLAQVWSPVGLLNSAMNSEALRAAYNACLPLLTNYYTEVGQSEALFEAYQAIEQQEGPGLDPEQRRVLEHQLRNFRLGGVGLPADRKTRFRAVSEELSQLQSKFDENVLDATNAWSRPVTDSRELDGLPAAVIEQARQLAAERGVGGWVLSLQQPTYVAVMSDAKSRELRRDFYAAWSTRASDRGPTAGRFDNTPVMQQIMALRHEQAKLVGYRNYAEYALATRMAKSPQEVLEFLQAMVRSARPFAERELAELERFAGRSLEAWDVGYYSEQLQRDRYAISQEALRPHFPLPRVLDGLFGVISRLFSLRIAERQGVAVWHPDVRFFDIHQHGTVIGSFYLDPYARTNKRSGAWMDDCVGRQAIDGKLTLPVAYLVCNVLPPAAGQPALLTHDDVVTLFHEFGHGLHHLLTRVAYPSIAGINGVAWDAVELPSQFLENYAWHPDVLQSMSQHVETGEPLPADTRDKLLATRVFQAGLATMRQLEFALFDFRLHAEYDPTRGAQILPLLAEVRREVAVIRPPDWNRFPHNFGHVFAGGYAAGYYSYKWAEVLAADAFAAFEERGVFDRSVAQRYLDAILSRGGSREALDAFVEFRGRKPEIEPLLKQLGLAA
ncbi:MAG TPA: M3 family metallopeptidase [Steroidobacteraceae bacterium]|nr:M3 family metallopeptidase [Steroidobacteraceae bacterium]HRX88544.1 M3 family metallopeptidase [Steroidobacteraceae bacterium]